MFLFFVGGLRLIIKLEYNSDNCRRHPYSEQQDCGGHRPGSVTTKKEDVSVKRSNVHRPYCYSYIVEHQCFATILCDDFFNNYGYEIINILSTY